MPIMPTATLTSSTNGAFDANGVRPLDPALVQLGGTGLKEYGGYINEDFLAQMNGREAVRIFTEMSLNDPLISAVNFAVSMLLRQVEWRVEAADESSAAEAGKTFVEECLDDMSHSWSDFMAEVLSMLPYGWAAHAIVWKKRMGPNQKQPEFRSKFTDGKYGIRKLPIRAQDTLLRWEMSPDGGVVGLHQLLPNGTQEFIPIERMLLFRTQSHKNNPEGRSILRGAYVVWERKKAVEAAEGRAAMRAAGVVVFRIPARYMSADADESERNVALAYRTLADRLAQDRQGSVVLPSDVGQNGQPLVDFSYVTADGRRPADMSPIVERYDKRIVTTVLADFLLLGQQAIGSFALSSDKTALFAQACGAYLKQIADVLNRYLLPRLWELNNFPQETMPRLVPGDIETPDLTELAGFVTALSSAGMPLFPDDDVEAYLRQAGGLPEKKPGSTAMPQQQQQQQESPPAPEEQPEAA